MWTLRRAQAAIDTDPATTTTRITSDVALPPFFGGPVSVWDPLGRHAADGPRRPRSPRLTRQPHGRGHRAHGKRNWARDRALGRVDRRARGGRAPRRRPQALRRE